MVVVIIAVPILSAIFESAAFSESERKIINY